MATRVWRGSHRRYLSCATLVTELWTSVTRAGGCWTDRKGTTLAVLAMLPALLVSVPARAGVAQKPLLHFESSPSGEIGLVARGVSITDALNAVAKKAGFEVLVEKGVARPLVNLTMPMAPIEDVLREMLRGRNYALVYDADTDSLSRVILLAPSTPGRAGGASVPARKPQRQKARSPVVVRN